jgi:hypothetical protein
MYLGWLFTCWGFFNRESAWRTDDHRNITDSELRRWRVKRLFDRQAWHMGCLATMLIFNLFSLIPAAIGELIG